MEKSRCSAAAEISFVVVFILEHTYFRINLPNFLTKKTETCTNSRSGHNLA